MTQSNLRYFLATLALFGNGTFTFAQSSTRHHPAPRVRPVVRAAPTATPAAMTTISSPVVPVAPQAVPTGTPFMDIHPFQSQIALRSNTKGINDGMFEVIPSVTVDEYKYRVPGVQGLQSAFKTALMYDKQNALPQLTVSGANFAFYEGGYMSTITSDGSFFFKGKAFMEPDVIGGVYYTEKGTNTLYVVDSYGTYYNTMNAAPSIKVAGGNYFIDASGTLTTIKSMGVAPGNWAGIYTRWDGASFTNIRGAGGNFFVKEDGAVVTVDAVTGQYKSFSAQSAPKLFGGNYFIGMDDRLYTVSNDGNLTQTDDFVLSQVPTLMAYSMMRFPNGKVLMVDAKGIPHDTLLRISDTGIKVEPTKVLPYQIDAKSIYLPNRQK